MCGILGTINLPIDHNTLNLLSHRGPDGEGLCRIKAGEHEVAFGHRRLSIVDLSEHGAQPMSTTDGRHHIIYNGEIYNHQVLRSELSNCYFRGHSDSESLLQALAAHGIDAVNRLNGIFSFSYLDTRAQKLFLARDPFGVKPVYYSITPRHCSFASELRPLLTIADHSVDSDGLAALLKLRFVPSPRTLYTGIRKLRPGHLLEVDLASTNLSWREYPFVAPNKNSSRSPMQFEEAVDEYGRLFQQAVSRQLMSDVEVGVLLSGGIDSALVASVAQQASDKPLRAFTVGFKDSNGTGIDEINGAGETAEYLGMEHLTMRISSEDFFETLRKSVQIVEEPLATTSIVPMHFLSKLAGNYVKVVMSGQGADEILGGYKRYQVELWRNLIPPFVANLGFKALRLFGSKNATLERGLRALSESDDVSRFLEAYQVFSDNEIVQLTGINSQPANDDIRYTYDLLQCAALPSSVQRMMCIDARLGLSDDLLLYTDKISMHESLECRVPILDLELVQFVESLPHEYRLGFGKGKIIHKEYAERVLPEEIVSRPKRGFLSPTNEWFKDEKMLRDLLLNRSSEFANHFDLSAVENIIRKHQSGFNQERQIFVLLCLSFCLENSR